VDAQRRLHCIPCGKCFDKSTLAALDVLLVVRDRQMALRRAHHQQQLFKCLH
jgi:hypothetical protein